MEKEAVYREMCRKEGDNQKLAPHAEEFLDFLCENDIPHTIATMSGIENVEFYIDHFNLKKWFDIDKIVYANGKIPGSENVPLGQLRTRLNEIDKNRLIVC